MCKAGARSFLWTLTQNSSFVHRNVSLKFIHSQNLYMQHVFIIFFTLIHNDVVQKKPKYSKELFSFIDQSYSSNSRHIDTQISPALIMLKLSYFGKKTTREKWKFYEFLVREINKLIRDSRITNLNSYSELIFMAYFGSK